jgi:hypothetical protein
VEKSHFVLPALQLEAAVGGGGGRSDGREEEENDIHLT